MNWKTLLAYITGTVDQELLLRNEYLVAEDDHHLEGIYPHAHGRAGGHRLLHR